MLKNSKFGRLYIDMYFVIICYVFSLKHFEVGIFVKGNYKIEKQEHIYSITYYIRINAIFSHHLFLCRGNGYANGRPYGKRRVRLI